MDVSMEPAAMSLHLRLKISDLQTHKGVEVAPSDTKDDGVLTIPKPNFLRLRIAA